MAEQKNAMQELMEKRKRQQEEAENAQNFTPIEFEQVKYMGLTDSFKVFRPIGLPYPVRQKPTDPKFMLVSKLLKDDGSGYSIIRWKISEKNGAYIPDESFPLAKLYNMTTKKEWENYDKPILNRDTGKEEKGKWKYFYKETDTYLKVNTDFGNGKKDEKYPPSFYPSGVVMMNVIDRMDDWCKKNKHSKILTKRVDAKDYKQEDGSVKTIEFVNIPGIPSSTNRTKYISVYDKMEDICAQTSGAFEDADYIVKKIGKDYQVSNTIQKVYNNEVSIKDFINFDSGLTKEEMEYELYNLNELYDDCPELQCVKLVKHHMGLIKKVDVEIGVDNGVCSTDEVLRLAEIGNKMIAERIKKQKEKEAKEEPKSEVKQEAPKEETKSVEQPKQERQARGTSTPNSEMSVEKQCELYFPKWSECDELDKKAYVDFIDHFEDNGQKIVWKSDKVTSIILCDQGCTSEIPNSSYVCAKCGQKYS